ncbi:hypothetical protein Sm713_75720 [Streptomyces sp. TS71-3]|nr:hypothetical protein Sm713_75720 [Streptomyces sp. TS71-3]
MNVSAAWFRSARRWLRAGTLALAATLTAAPPAAALGSGLALTPQMGIGNSWRTTGDINAGFSSMLSIFHRDVGLAPYAGPGHWNDPDMLEVGNGSLTAAESRSEFSLGSEMGSAADRRHQHRLGQRLRACSTPNANSQHASDRGPDTPRIGVDHLLNPAVRPLSI